jgi:hypothetical protein
LVIVTQAVTADWQEQLHAYANNGGTILFATADHEAALSVPFFFAGMEPKSPVDQPQGEYLLLGDIDFTHPLFAPFAGPKYGDFTKIHFWKHQPLSVMTSDETRVVAKFDNGEPAILERMLGKGRVLAIASGWNPDQSQFALSSKFVPFVASLLDLACGEVRANLTATIHEPIDLPLAAGAEPIVVGAPGGKSVTLSTGTNRFTGSEQPGIYLARTGTNEMRFAVNLSTAESNTAPLELEQLEQRGVRLGNAASRNERIDRMRQERDIELESRQKIWRWLIVAAVGVLFLETWLAGNAVRRLRAAAPQIA